MNDTPADQAAREAAGRLCPDSGVHHEFFAARDGGCPSCAPILAALLAARAEGWRAALAEAERAIDLEINETEERLTPERCAQADGMRSAQGAVRWLAERGPKP